VVDIDQGCRQDVFTDLDGRSMDLFDLSGRRALVLGASAGGLGFHAAVALRAAGCEVVVSDLAAAVDAGGRPDGTTCVPADLTDERSVTDLFDEVDRGGPLDIVVNFAGSMLRKPTVDTSLEEWRAVVDVNLTASFLVARASIPRLTARGSGKLVLTSSIYDRIVGPLPEPAYYASKAAVGNLTRGLAAELGPSNVQVNCIAPGVFFPTRMTQPLADQPGRLEQMAGRTLAGRLGDPAADIGGTVVFLCSPASDYVTGQTIYVDGGWTAS
jgi:gluconate 5-dehydrogenase